MLHIQDLVWNISAKFHEILTSHIGEEVENISVNQGLRWRSWILDGSEKQQLLFGTLQRKLLLSFMKF